MPETLSLITEVCPFCRWVNGTHASDCVMAQGAARRLDRPTAKAAAESVAATALEAVVLEALVAMGEGTIHEVSVHTGRPEVSISPRFAPLLRKGLIVDTGRTKPNPSGRAGTIWRPARG